jgi:hypothetical protein
VIVNHARRINRKLVAHTCLMGKRAEDFFSSYGATDVAKAYEEDVHLIKVLRLKVMRALRFKEYAQIGINCYMERMLFSDFTLNL